jgi:hypothetical protein
MKTATRLIVAMAAQCRRLIQQSVAADTPLRGALHPKHLLWMCDKIEDHADAWPITKLHRWIGFVQCGMMANRMLDLDGAKAMFDEAKIAYGGAGEDEDLIDHLCVEMELGGQG